MHNRNIFLSIEGKRKTSSGSWKRHEMLIMLNKLALPGGEGLVVCPSVERTLKSELCVIAP